MKTRILNWIVGLVTIVALAYVFGYEGFWCWVVENTVVPPNQMLVLVAKTGREMPPGQIIAEPGQKGVLLEPLGPGRHFVNPFCYERQLHPQVVIKGGELGVMISKFGRELPDGEFLAGPDERGIRREVLTAGTYKLNPYAYEIRITRMPEIEPGYVGVFTARSGKTAQSQLAAAGEKGVQRKVLQPGLYPLNPEAFSIEPIEIGFNQITMAHAGKLPTTQTVGQTVGKLRAASLGQGLTAEERQSGQSGLPVLPAVTFPSSDGFEITIDVTVLWQLLPDDAPSVVARYGNIKKIEQNILIPQINSAARIKGSTFGAVDFIVGDKREEFQRAFQESIESALEEKRLQVDLALVQDTLVPDNISGPIQDSRVAAEWNTTNAEQTTTEAKRAELEESLGRIRQVELIVEFETQRLEGNIQAEQEKQVRETAAQTRLLVADLERQTALVQADTMRKLGNAEARVVAMLGKAEGDGYALLVSAVGTPAEYAFYQFSLNLPERIPVRLIYAGPGTLWTDLGKEAGPPAVMETLRLLQPEGEDKP